MEQTAVQWFVREIAMKNNDINFDFWAAVEQAIEMEKQQIIDAHGDKLKQSGGTSNYEYWFTGEDYYNKTFKK